MRIVFITPDLSGRSGWSRYALDMGKALEQQGHELHCIVAEKTDTLWCRQYPVLRQPTSYLGNPLPLFLSALRLRSLLRKIRPDIVHFIAEPYALMLPFLPTASWKTCMTIHGTYAVLPFSLRGKVRQFFETAYRRCDRIVSVSHFTKNFVEMRVPAFFQEQNLSQKIVVLENAVDLTRFPYSEKKMSDAPVRTIISVSAVKQKKGYRQGLDALALFRESHTIPLRYDIYGSLAIQSDFIKELRTHITRLGLSDIVTLHGSVSDDTLRKAYETAAVFLLPSLQDGDYVEGFGLVFLEANAQGTPVIGPTTGGCPEAIRDGVSGYVCEPTDTIMIAKRLEDVLIRHAIEPAECRHWAEAHDIKKAAARLGALYAALLDTSS